MKLSKLSFLGALLVFAAGAAQATPMSWTDTAKFNPNVYVSQWNGFVYTQNLTHDGFNPAVDTISDYSLSLDLVNSSGGFLALVVPGTLSNAYINLNGNSFGQNLYLTADLAFSSTGVLTVGIISLLGNFYLASSTLTAYGNGVATSVPEPGVITLLALGLAAIALLEWRKRRAHAPGLASA
jgi:hypothetical protein